MSVFYHGVELDSRGNDTMVYHGVYIADRRGRFMVILNKDLLDLGMCKPGYSLRKGHRGYVSLKTLCKKIDKSGLDRRDTA